MNPYTLKAILKVRNLKSSDLSKRTGISKQLLSHWFAQRNSTLNIHSKNLTKLAAGLGLTVDALSRPMPILEDGAERNALETNLNWDRIYPDLESLIRGILRNEDPALARIVQVYGLFQAEKIIGKIVWKKFPHYKSKMSLAQRKQNEILWNLHKSKNLELMQLAKEQPPPPLAKIVKSLKKTQTK